MESMWVTVIGGLVGSVCFAVIVRALARIVESTEADERADKSEVPARGSEPPDMRAPEKQSEPLGKRAPLIASEPWSV